MWDADGMRVGANQANSLVAAPDVIDTASRAGLSLTPAGGPATPPLAQVAPLEPRLWPPSGIGRRRTRSRMLAPPGRTVTPRPLPKVRLA